MRSCPTGDPPHYTGILPPIHCNALDMTVDKEHVRSNKEGFAFFKITLMLEDDRRRCSRQGQQTAFALEGRFTQFDVAVIFARTDSIVIRQIQLAVNYSRYFTCLVSRSKVIMKNKDTSTT